VEPLKGWLSYAVIANWSEDRIELRDTVMDEMNSIGKVLRSVISEQACGGFYLS
jgi:hypothetical protein